MDKLRVQVNGRGYYLKTDKPDEVLKFAKDYEKRILYITSKMPGITEAEATALSALLIMGDSLKKERSDEDQALIDELNGKIEVLEERADMLSSEISAHNDAENSFRSEISSLREREQDLLTRLSASNDKEEKLTAACSDSENALNDTKSALASANKIIAQLNTEKFTEVAANEALRKELEASQGRLEAANKIIAELNGKLTNLEINVIAENPDEADFKKLKEEKEELEIELAIANEEIEKLKSAEAPADESEMAKKIAEYEKKIRQLENRGGEIDKLRGILAETEHSVRQKVDEKEEENQKLRNILKNYENSYGTTIAKKEEEILGLQCELEELREKLGSESDSGSKAKFVQTTFES